MIAQLVLNTSELATWFIGAVISAMCFLLYRLLSRLEKNQEIHAQELKEHGEMLVEHDVKIESIQNKLK